MTEFAPGKIIFAGEWAVLEPENCAIVFALNRGVFASVKESDKILIPKNSIFVKSAVDVVGAILPQKKFSLTIKSDISKITLSNGKRIKAGLGSSAAVVVAVIKVLLKFYGIKAAKKLVFKLSAIAHYLAQGGIGSCIDVAASTYGGALLYSCFDHDWLSDKLKKFSICEIVALDWPRLKISTIKVPKNMKIYLGFAGKSASTPDLIKKMAEFKEKNKETYHKICFQISQVVRDLASEMNNGRQQKIIALINQNRFLLQKLSKESGIDLETKILKKMCDDAVREAGVAAKFSGAGGGDCAIAVSFNNFQSPYFCLENIKPCI
jgi:phosphomevalonate kinase